MREIGMKTIIEHFLQSWRAGKIDRALLSDDFEYKGLHSSFDTESWLDFFQDEEELVNIELIRTVINKDSAAVLFEYFDDITEIRYAFSWFLKIKNEKILDLIECRYALNIKEDY